MNQRNITFLLIAVFSYFLLAGGFLSHINSTQWVEDKLTGFGHFFLLGLGGAIIANSTGAGGGIVFIPAFSTLGLSGNHALGTSIMIQCFGMTAGSISWYIGFRNRKAIYQRYSQFMLRILLTAGLSSVAGALLSQFLFREHITVSMLTVFSVLSILFGLILLYSNLSSSSKGYPRAELSRADYQLIIPICLLGGAITSIISIGIGEILLILLFLRRYPMHVAIFAAVSVSAMTVIACAPYQIVIAKSVVWDIVAFAAPAAMLGGVLGHYLSLMLGATRIKIVCAIWILITGILI